MMAMGEPRRSHSGAAWGKSLDCLKQLPTGMVATRAADISVERRSTQWRSSFAPFATHRCVAVHDGVFEVDRARWRHRQNSFRAF